MKKSDFMRKLSSTDIRRSFGEYIILVDDNWGPIMSRGQAEEEWSRFKNSGKTFDEWKRDFI